MYELQVKYCKENNLPVFAPERNCPYCNKNIYERITEHEAANGLITSCPYCNRSYVE
jgi:uncharacterized Zn-finger protein